MIGRTLLTGLIGLLALTAVPVSLLAVVLVATATTLEGRLIGAVFVLGPPAVVLGLSALLVESRRLGLGALTLGFIAALAFGGSVALAPSGQPSEDAMLRHVWLNGEGFRRFALTNLTPEVDQFTLGAQLVTLADPIIDRVQASRIQTLFQKVYAEQRRNPDAVEVGSVMHLAYGELLGAGPGRGHLYQLRTPDEVRAVVLFVHGSAGPFRSYQHVLAPLTECGIDVVSPTFGFGNWSREGGTETLVETVEWIRSQPRYRDRSIVLAGLSNGGLGASRAAAAMPNEFAAVVYISAVLTASDAAAVARECPPDLPVFVVHGTQDRRIPTKWLMSSAGVLEEAGFEVHTTLVPDEDHFLLFSQAAPILEVIRTAVDASAR